MHCWHDVKRSRITPESFLALIEISKGSKNKYELDKDTGRLILDRVLFTSTHYPQNYGFIPLTYARDLDPIDVLVLCSEPIIPMSFVKCRPIGVMVMTDDGKPDEKIIAVAENDPFYNVYKNIDELPEHVLAEIKNFFEVYKTLEGKETSVGIIKDAESAKRAIQASMEKYQREIEPQLIEARKRWLMSFFIDQRNHKIPGILWEHA